MIHWLDEYNRWLEENDSKIIDKQLKKMETKEKKEFFRDELTFGTAGIREKIGIGTNKINKYTIIKFVKSYGLFLKEKAELDGVNLEDKKIIVFHDNRRNAEKFTEYAARTLIGLGLNVKLSFENELQPTPLLSYFISNKEEYYGGINVTASHNPKEYSGLKFYSPLGSQITNADSEKILEFAKDVDYFNNELGSLKSDNLTYFNENFEQEYIEEILVPLIKKPKKSMEILFSPQHGTSLKIIKDISKRIGINLTLVKSQSNPDPEFSNTLNPNPGTMEAFQEAIPIAVNRNIPIIISIDPDGDRLGLMIKDDNNWVRLNGNELAILILNYLIKNTPFYKRKNRYIVKSIVTSDSGKRIAEKNGISVYETLTGFKNLASRSKQVKDEEAAQGIKPKKIKKSLFIYEESYGSIINDSIKDKDAFQAFILVVRMLGDLTSHDLNVSSQLSKIWSKYGYTSSVQITRELATVEEAEEYIFNLKKHFSNPENLDRLKPLKFSHIDDFMEPSDPIMEPSKGIKIYFNNNSWVAIRPSGTEPILKFYFDFFELDSQTEQKILEEFEKIHYQISQ